MPLDTENITSPMASAAVRDIAAKLVSVMAANGIDFYELACRLGRIETEVKESVANMIDGKNVSVADMACIAYALGYEVVVTLKPARPSTAALSLENAPPSSSGGFISQIGDKILDTSDIARVVYFNRGVHAGALGLLVQWKGRRAEVTIANNVGVVVPLIRLRFATHDEVMANETMRGTGHTQIYANEKEV